MPDLLALSVLLLACTLAGMIAGVVGFGSIVLIMPLVISVFGPEAAVPMLTVAAIVGNASRVALWYREVDLDVVKRYWMGAVPLAAAGGWLFTKLESPFITLMFGVFLVISAVLSYRDLKLVRVKLKHFTQIGGAMGLVSALVASSGPINAPFFLAYGLTKGAYLSTEALSTLGIHLTKVVAYGSLSVMSGRDVLWGLSIGIGLWFGAWLSKPIVTRFADGSFRRVFALLLAAAGIQLIVQFLELAR